jgi:signal transduction histidine kinase
MSQKLCVESLLKIEIFRVLPAERLDWICDRAEHIELSPGAVVISEGEPPRGFCIQLNGQITVTRMSNGADMPVGRHTGPTFFGEVQCLTENIVPVTLTTDCHTDLYWLDCNDFIEMLHSCREFEKNIMRIVEQRMRGLESFIRNREKMAALGTLAAGLAHELNNPAAALVRALKDVKPALLELQRMNLVYGQQQVDQEHTQKWEELRDRGFAAIANPKNDPMAQSEREDALTDWLEDYGIEDSWRLAEPLAAGEVDLAVLELLMERWRAHPSELREMGIRWLALSFDVMGMVTSGLDGAERISTLVQSMKSYSYMDQAAQQLINIHDGIEDTLRLFAFKLKQGIKVERHYDQALPPIMAFGSELNQVWTNLLDNAIDALNEATTPGTSPQIIIRTCQKGNQLRVEIQDNGPGIPIAVKNRIFEPFFTTKPMGKGSGLGLDLAHRIIENRHKGSLMVESVPGKTCFAVSLPLSN